jgi:hypothetical protein
VPTCVEWGTYAIEIVATALAVENARGGMVEKIRRQVGDAKHGGHLLTISKTSDQDLATDLPQANQITK